MKPEAMTPPNLIKPTPELVAHYVEKFDRDNAADEQVIKWLFQQFPRNRVFEEVLVKVVSLNTLYSTRIFAVREVAKRICELDTDEMLQAKTPQLVNEMAKVTVGTDKTRWFYSFASKYCSWHVPDAYPIFDSRVEELIWAYRKKDGFADFKRQDLWDYRKFKGVIENFRSVFGLTNFTFKDLDKFLWGYGQQTFSQRPAQGP